MPYTSTSDLDHPHTSDLLHQLVEDAPHDTFTLGWLIGHLPNRSFGVILLFLSLIAVVPVISIPARLLILMLIAQIMLGYKAPMLPEKLLKRPLPTHYLKRLNKRVVPLLHRLETLVRPRWCGMLDGKIRRGIAAIAFLLTILSLLAPLPLANVPPSIICALIALAYIEHDGVLLMIALTLGCALLSFAVALIV